MDRGTGAVAVAVLALALLGGGCGGSSAQQGSTSLGNVTTASNLTKAEFVKKANAICKRGSDQIHAEAEAFEKEHGIENVALNKKQEEEFVTEAVVPSIQAQAGDLKELGAPKGDQREVTAIVDGLGKVAKAGEEDPGTILVAGAGSLAQVNKAATAYGVKECKQP